MPGTASHASTSAVRSRSRQPASAQTAIALLKQDHKEVSQLAERFEKARTPQKKRIATAICRALTIHATIEEEIFYPAVRAVADEDLETLLNEAEVEHASVKDLVSQIEAMLANPGEEGMFEAKVKVLTEYVKHHVREEEREMFPLIRDTGLDQKALGAQLAERKAALEAG
jgi:hemerythrin superfamily protein